MNTTLTLLDDALMADLAGGTLGSFDGGLFAGNPVDRLQPVGGDLRHLIGPCPNPDGAFKSATKPDAFPIGPCPNPDAGGASI